MTNSADSTVRQIGGVVKVTFDSNVWRIVSSPNSFPNESAIAEFRQIHDAIAQGKIGAYLSETVFTLEAVKKSGRYQFLAGYKPKVSFEETVRPDGSLALSIGIGPDQNSHPGNNPYLSKHWADCRKHWLQDSALHQDSDGKES